MSMALIIIDVQRGMFAFPEMQPFNASGTVSNIAALLARARTTSTPVFFVQHQGEAGHPLEPGTPGFPVHEALTPLPSELVIQKRHCNSFQDTQLEGALREAGIDTLVVTGMQTDYCVDTFVRAAKERGFNIHLVSDGHTTFDTPILAASEIVAHHNATLEGSFAKLVTASEVRFGS